MNKVIPVVISLFALAGCTQEQAATQKSLAVTPVQEVQKAETVMEEPGAQIAPPADIVQQMQAQIKAAQQQKAPAKAIQGADEIISENRWGLSVYDPQTGITQYFTSNGGYLGERKNSP
jgi:hypothetical protein